MEYIVLRLLIKRNNNKKKRFCHTFAATSVVEAIPGVRQTCYDGDSRVNPMPWQLWWTEWHCDRFCL